MVRMYMEGFLVMSATASLSYHHVSSRASLEAGSRSMAQLEVVIRQQVTYQLTTYITKDSVGLVRCTFALNSEVEVCVQH